MNSLMYSSSSLQRGQGEYSGRCALTNVHDLIPFQLFLRSGVLGVVSLYPISSAV